MRTLLIILMVLGFLASITFAILTISLNAHMKKVDREEVEQVQQAIATLEKQVAEAADSEVKAQLQGQIDEMKEKVAMIPSEGTVSATKMLGILTTVLALVFIITVFMKKASLSTKIGIGAAILGVVVLVICPSIDGGMTGPADPKQIATIGFIGLAVSVVTGILSHRFVKAKAVEA